MSIKYLTRIIDQRETKLLVSRFIFCVNILNRYEKRIRKWNFT